MAFEQRDNSGTLFKNARKENPSHADYNGSIMVDGVMYWINAWIKDGAKGKFMSLSVKPKEGVKANKPTQRRNAPDDDSEIPF